MNQNSYFILSFFVIRKNWPQLRLAPIVKVLYKQANIGFAAEAVFFRGGERGRFAPKKGVTLYPRATDFWEKKFSTSSIRIVSYCKYVVYFNKYDMYSIIGIDKKHMEKELV